MNWKRSKQFLLALVSILIVLLSGTALAQNDINSEGIDIVRFGGNVIVGKEQVVQDAIAFGGSVTVLQEGRVTGDAVAFGGNVVLEERARVDGDAVAFGGAVIQAEGATIGGDIVTGLRNDRGGMEFLRRWGIFSILVIGFVFYAFVVVALAALGILLLLLIPNFLQSIVAVINRYAAKSALWGLGSIVAVIFLSALLAGSLIGSLLIPIINLAILIGGVLGAISTSLLIGRKILTASTRHPIQQFLIGLLLLALIGWIPIVGGLLFFAVTIFGCGAILLWKFGKVQPPVDERTSDTIHR
jgi:hypothetical protein